MAAYVYHGSGRNRATFVALGIAWGLIALAWLVFGAAPIVVALATLATLPALWDLITARRSGVTVTERQITWFAGPHEDALDLTQIDFAQFHTRLDFSVRVKLLTVAGPILRLPSEATGPAKPLAAALQARGVTVEHRHFALLG